MEFLIIILLLLVNGLFAMYEIAMVSSSKARLETLALTGSHKARSVLQQLEEPEKILSTIQVGITLIGIVSGAYGGVAIAGDVVPLFERIPLLAPYADKVALILVVSIITYLSLIVGELVPKSLALNNPERIAITLSPFMVFLSKTMYPFVWILSLSTRLVNRMMGIKTGEERPMTEEELKFILHKSSQQGVIDKEETEMIKDVFRFTDKRANELMTHRKEIIFLDVKQTKEEVLNVIELEKFSKYLLCDGSLDNAIGLVVVKDIVLLLRSDKPFDLRSIVHEPLYIPECLTANRILELFKTNKTNFGVVVSEYGGIEGIITLRDLTESIFGDIPDIGDDADEPIVRRQDGSMLVDGSMKIDDFMDEMGILNYDESEVSDFTTLGGLSMYLLKNIPKTGDRFSFKDLYFEVVDMDGSRVDKLLVEKKFSDE